MLREMAFCLLLWVKIVLGRAEAEGEESRVGGAETEKFLERTEKKRRRRRNGSIFFAFAFFSSSLYCVDPIKLEGEIS